MDKLPTANTETKKKKLKLTGVVVDAEDLRKKQSLDIASRKMEMDPESEKLAKANWIEKRLMGEWWSRLGQKVWKHGMKRDYNFNKEVYKAYQEILESGNVFIGEGKDKISHDKVMSDIINQFSSGYKETIHEKAGEKKIEIGTNETEEEATGDKESIKQLIKDYASGKISVENFKEQEKRIFHQIKENVDEEKIKEDTLYASNLIELGEQLKIARKNKEFLDNEDFDLELIYGESKASVRTEAHFTQTERIIDKMLHTKVGQFTNETSLTIGLSCAYHLIGRSVVSLPGKIVPILGTATIGAWFGGQRGKIEAENKRVAQSRSRAKGEIGREEKFDAKNMPHRAELDKYNYKTESADVLIKNIDTNLSILEKNGANVTEQELRSVFADLASIEALIRLSDDRHIDLITYSDTTKVVEERMNLDVKKRQIKDALEKAYVGRNFQIPNGQSFEEYFNSLTKTEQNRLISEEKTGIDAKDKEFNKFKRKAGIRAAIQAFKSGILIGAFLSEFFGSIDGLWGGTKVGLIEDLSNGDHPLPPGVGTENLTFLNEIKHIFQGDIPTMDMGVIHEVLIGDNNIKLPEGVNMPENPDGSYNLVGDDGKIFGENLTLNPDGSLTDEAKNILTQNGVVVESHLIEGVETKSVGPQEYVKNHLSDLKEIHRLGWLDNETVKFDLNELKLQMGGLNGTGIDADGNYVLNIGNMTSDGSFNSELSVDAQELMKAGQLKILFSISESTQGHGFELTPTPDGKIIIPPGSELGKTLWENVNGDAKFLGRFGEIAQDMGDGKYIMLSTMEGDGLKDITDIVKTQTMETVIITPGNYVGGTMPIIAVVEGQPLEKREKEANKEEKKTQEEGVKPVVTEINPNKKEQTIEKDGGGDMIFGAAGSLSTKEKEKNKAIEISQEEYDAMKDDMKMLEKKRQDNLGIITTSQNDFKSEYGKKRYMDLKSIPEGIPVRFNKTELQTIGDEIEGLLSKSKVISKEEMAKRLENKKAITNQEISNRAYEIYEKRLKEGKEGDQDTDWFEAEKQLKEENDKNQKNHFKKINEVKAEIEKNIVEKEKIKTNESTTSNSTETKNNFRVEDLSKMGTVFETKEGYTFTIAKLIKPWFGSNKVEGILKDKNGKEHLVSYKLKQLGSEFKNGNIKITKLK